MAYPWLRACALTVLCGIAGCEAAPPKDPAEEGGAVGGSDGAEDAMGGGAEGDAGDGGRDATPGEGGDGSAEAGVLDLPPGCEAGDTTAVDLLFVIDNSGSMAEEQKALARELKRMVGILTSGDGDGDGEVDMLPVENLHLGVVSTDLGAAGTDAADMRGCAVPGDDGHLLFADRCEGKSPDGNFLSIAPGDDASALADQFACIAQLGTRGCALEQPLDAMLKALTEDPSLRFHGDSTGHGGPPGGAGANAGFLREEALLAVIVVTDEDDCSLPDENAAVMELPTAGVATLESQAEGGTFSFPLDTAPNLRCQRAPEALHDLDRYVDGLRALKPGHPERVVFGAITGIPVALEGMDADGLLAHPSMEIVPEPDWTYLPAAARPSCEFSDPNDLDARQYAYPPRRIVELAGRFGESGLIRSICQDDFSGSLDAILDKITRSVTCISII